MTITIHFHRPPRPGVLKSIIAEVLAVLDRHGYAQTRKK